MTTGRWAQLDTLRESWVFLLLDEIDPAESDTDYQLGYWEFGVGNADSFIGTEAARIGYEGIESESELLHALLAELDQYKYRGMVLITPTNATVQTLRQRSAMSYDREPSLRGLAHIVVEEQLKNYFGETLESYELDQASRSGPRVTETTPKQVVSAGSAKAFWNLWTRIFRLLPATELVGEDL